MRMRSSDVLLRLLYLNRVTVLALCHFSNYIQKAILVLFGVVEK